MFTTLLFPLLALAASNCIDIVPGKSLGPFKLGDNEPSGKVAGFPVQQDPQMEMWRMAGPFRFYVEGIKVIGLSYVPPSADYCYSLKGKKLPNFQTWKELRNAFPNCKYEARLGGNVVVCDGMTWYAGEPKTFPPDGVTFEVRVNTQTLHKMEVEQNTSYVKYLLKKEWPYIDLDKQPAKPAAK